MSWPRRAPGSSGAGTTAPGTGMSPCRAEPSSTRPRLRSERPSVPSGRTRRNVTIGSGHVPTEPGARFGMGDVELEVVRKAAPCRVMDREIGDGARRAMHGRGGAVCRVLTSGTIAVGDVATI